MVETKMHVSPDMVSEDMKNWTPDDWTKHLQEMASLIYIIYILFPLELKLVWLPRQNEEFSISNST